MHIPADILVFDMDGVLLLSNRLKHDAMLGLFDMNTAQRLEVQRYNLGAGGIPRRQKFEHIWRQILGRSYSPAVEATLSAAYAQALEHRLLSVPLVEGVQAFIECCGRPCYVCTAAPEAEARGVLSRRGLVGLFAGIYGSASTKQMALEAIASVSRHAVDRVLFFGDSRADLLAARAAGCLFVGVTREKNDFAGCELPVIRDFQDPIRLQQSFAATAMNLKSGVPQTPGDVDAGAV